MLPGGGTGFTSGLPARPTMGGLAGCGPADPPSIWRTQRTWYISPLIVTIQTTRNRSPTRPTRPRWPAGPNMPSSISGRPPTVCWWPTTTPGPGARRSAGRPAGVPGTAWLVVIRCPGWMRSCPPGGGDWGDPDLKEAGGRGRGGRAGLLDHGPGQLRGHHPGRRVGGHHQAHVPGRADSALSQGRSPGQRTAAPLGGHPAQRAVPAAPDPGLPRGLGGGQLPAARLAVARRVTAAGSASWSGPWTPAR